MLSLPHMAVGRGSGCRSSPGAGVVRKSVRGSKPRSSLRAITYACFEIVILLICQCAGDELTIALATYCSSRRLRCSCGHDSREACSQRNNDFDY